MAQFLADKCPPGLTKRDKASVDTLWFRDDALSDSDSVQALEVIAQEIVEDLKAELKQSLRR